MATRPIVDKSTPPPMPVADRLLLAEELLDLAERAQGHTRAAGSAIALKLGEKLYVRTSTGIAPEVGTSLLMGEGAIGECARLGKPYNVSDESQIDVTLRALGVRSLIAVPIHHAGIFYGVLLVVAQTPEAFTRMQVAILMTMGNEIARVLKRMEPAAMEIAPGTPMRTGATPATPTVPADNVVEISLSPTAKQEIVETLKSIEQKPAPAAVAPAPMKLMIDTPVVPKPAPIAPAKPVPAATVLTAAQLSSAPVTDPEAPKPLADLLPPGEDPRRYGTLKSAKSLEPKPTYIAANAFAQPRPSSSLKTPLIAAAALVVAIAGFAAWRYTKQPAQAATVEHAIVPATTPSAAAIATPAVTTPAAEPLKPAITPPVVATAKPDTTKKSVEAKGETKAEPKAEAKTEAKLEQPKSAPESPALHIAAAAARADAPVQAPNLVLATNAALPDLGTPKAPAASLLLKRSTAVPPAVLRQIQPIYPELARRAGVYGNVRLQITVSTTGTASNVRVIDGPPILRASAVAAVSRWQYRAATLDGRPVESTMEVVVKFSQP